MKVVLTIAGSDSSGGAGIQADLKTFEAFDLFGCSVITVLTAQNTNGVNSIETLKPEFIKEQIEAVLNDFDVACIKIGMLFSNEIINIVEKCIKNLDIPIVIDPVFISKAGSKLLNDDAIENLKSLFKYAKIITPNLYEAKHLFNYNENDNFENLSNLDYAVLIKNHKIKDHSYDKLFYKNKVITFCSKYLQTNNTHGTGCSFSSAIASNIALGKNLEDSIKISKDFIYKAILLAPNLGNGKGPIAHKKALLKVIDNQKLKGLYAISDDKLTPSKTILTQIEDALKGGVNIIQLRDKSNDLISIRKQAIQIQNLCKKYDALFVLNDEIDLAIELNCDGLHIGKSDHDKIDKIRKNFKGILGVSCYDDISLAKNMQDKGVDYVAFGSFYCSPTKPKSKVIDLNILRKAKENLNIPICAIGGINDSNIDEVLHYKPDMIAMISNVWEKEDIKNSCYDNSLKIKDNK